MAAEWDKMNGEITPELSTITAYVNNPLWDDLLAYMQQRYQVAPVVVYSGCAAAPGWNVKFRKAGRALCTLYPEAGGFITLVVIGQREKPEAELALPTFSAYTQALYHATDVVMNQRWLMMRVDSPEVLADAKACIALRRKPQ